MLFSCLYVILTLVFISNWFPCRLLRLHHMLKIGSVIPAMSSMDKMWMSFIAIGLMIAASLVVMFTRAKLKNRLLRMITMLAAAVLLFYGIIFMLVSIV